MPGGAVGFGEEAVGLIVVDETLAVGIPAELALQEHGDVAEVADGGGAVADLDGGGRDAAGFDGVDEVAVVICAVAQADVVGAEDDGLEVSRPAGEPAISGLDEAAIAFEADL